VLRIGRETKTNKAAARYGPGNRSYRPGLIFLSPWLVGLVLLTALPIFAAFYLSLTDYDLLSAPQFTGFDNFSRMISDDDFWDALWVSFKYVFISVPFVVGFALLVALVLNQGLRMMGVYRAAYYLPSLLGGSVDIAVLWQQIFGRGGLMNELLGVFGVAEQSYVASPNTALWTLILLNVWQFGSPMIIFLAGLKAIPRSLLEAARVDGANRFRAFLYITLPLLTPLIFFNVVMQTINSFKAFTPAYVVSGGTGGPLNSTLFYTLYIYQEGFQRFRMGYASALAIVLLIIIGGITGFFFLTSRYWVFYQED
jgi:multiple sugar transport system permease protein